MVRVTVGELSNLVRRTLSKYTLASESSSSVVEQLNGTVRHVGMSELIAKGSACPGKVFKVAPETVFQLAKHAAATLRNGGVIAVPTDTIYGLAADAQNDAAVRRLYQIKGRNCKKPISICLNRTSEFYRWAKVQVPSELLCGLLPGPLTLVFERSEHLNPNLNPETNLIGIRYPDFSFVDNILTDFGGPLALTSANPSSSPSTLACEEFEELWPSLDCIFDAGRLHAIDCNKNLFEAPDSQVEVEARLGSTVIDVSEVGYFRIIRKGVSCDRYIETLEQVHHLIQKFD